MTALLGGLFYIGYINGLLKGVISPIDRFVIAVGLIWSVYSGIRSVEVEIIARCIGAKKVTEK
jgi:hypothetical protein